MKRVLLSIAVILLLFGTAAAERVGYAGVLLDGDETRMTLGSGISLGGNFWSLTAADVGEYGTIRSELVFFVANTSKLHFGLFAGPNVDFVEPENQTDALTYVTGASGFLLSYDVSETAGAAIVAKYKFELQDTGAYDKTGWTTGIFAFGRF